MQESTALLNLQDVSAYFLSGGSIAEYDWTAYGEFCFCSESGVAMGEFTLAEISGG